MSRAQKKDRGPAARAGAAGPVPVSPANRGPDPGAGGRADAKSRVAWAFLLVAILGICGYFLLPTGSPGANLVYNALGLSAVAAVLVGVRRNRPRGGAAWYLLALGLLAFVIGDAIWFSYEQIFRMEAPFPSLADVSYLAGYPFLAAGLLVMVRGRSAGRDRAAFLDAAVIAVGGGVLVWVYLMSPYALDPSLPLLERAISVAYPLGDMLLFGVVARLAFAPGWRSPAGYLLIAALTLNLAADLIYSGATLAGTYRSGDLIDAGWLLGYALYGASALQPAMRSLTEPAPTAGDGTITRWRVGLIVGFALVAPAMIALQEVRKMDDDSANVLAISAAAAVMFLLVLLRMEDLVRGLNAASSLYERAAAREEILRRAGTKLVEAQDRKTVYRVAVETALKLTGDAENPRAYAATVQYQDLVVEAAAGDGAGRAEGVRFDVQELPEPLREGLLGRNASELRCLDAGRAGKALGFEQAEGLLVNPLIVGEESIDALVVASGPPFSLQIKDGLKTLSFQVSLALESMILGEDLSRRKSEARFQALIRDSSDVISVSDVAGRVVYQSPSTRWVLGQEPEGLIGANVLRRTGLVHPEDLARHNDAVAEAIRGSGTAVAAEVRMRHRDGSWRHMEATFRSLPDESVGRVVINARDITERKELQEQLSHQAFHDALTGLPNRSLFADRLGHALTRTERGEETIAILFLDLDDFKTVNDSLGHAAGDTLLVEVAERLISCIRPGDTVARLGGDEFALLVEDLPSREAAAQAAARLAERLADAFAEPYLLDGREVSVSPSIGIATETAGERADELLRNADVAMYAAKNKGKGRYEFYEIGMHAATLGRLELRADLKRAIERREFVVHYQPIVAIGGPPVVCEVEALVRWRHPERGIVPPGEFIPLAEETGDIVEIGLLVLEEACGQARRWRQCGLVPLILSVNLSARQFRRPDLVEQVSGVLAKTGLPADSLRLEITESAAMEDVESALATLRRLKNLGVKIAIDDFGTGYSSLSYLGRFPVDVLKIDRSFVGRLEADPESVAIVSTTVTLARNLGLEVVAEGVETAGQLAQLEKLECDLAQGYHFAAPLPPEEIPPLRESVLRQEEGVSSWPPPSVGRRIFGA